MRKAMILLAALALVALAAVPAMAQSPSVSNDCDGNVAPRNAKTLDYKLHVKGEPPENATFFGSLSTVAGVHHTQLTDPDGDGVYNGCLALDRDIFDDQIRVAASISGGQGVQTSEDHSTGPVPAKGHYTIEEFGKGTGVKDGKAYTATVDFREDGGEQQQGKRLVGTAAGDLLRGGPGDDRIEGLAGNDRLEGKAGDDLILGGYGHDLIFGGLGHDLIKAGPGSDAVYGGPGNDRIEVAGDGPNDYVDCGPGYDTVIADRGDNLVNCEDVRFK